MGRIKRKIYIPIFIILCLFNILFKVAEISVISLFFSIAFMLTIGRGRCHDAGHSGWIQCIPFANFYLMFKDGTIGANQYGDDPRGRGVNSNTQTSGKGNYYQQMALKGFENQLKDGYITQEQYEEKVKAYKESQNITD